MRVICSLVGEAKMRTEAPTWPEGWPVPRVGDEVVLKDSSTVTVRTVVWYPGGDQDAPFPHAYVVLGPRRP